MPTIEQSLTHEEEASTDRVRLIASGEFLRAYDRSAWKFHCCISKFKVIKKSSKQRQRDIFFLGFPANKLLELSGGRGCEKTDFGYDVVLKPDEVPAEEGYEAWTKEVPVEAASRAEASSVPLVGRELESAVCRKIREFPLEAKTPVEALVFLSGLRGMLVGEGLE